MNGQVTWAREERQLVSGKELFWKDGALREGIKASGLQLSQQRAAFQAKAAGELAGV